LYKGDYQQMTVYSDDPAGVAKAFFDAGAEFIHMVDLEGAKSGTTPNFGVVADIAENSGLKVEIGGGIRNEATIQKYLDAGVMRVILGTAAANDLNFVRDMVETYGDAIAVGVDLRDGYVAVKGWTETSGLPGEDFCAQLEAIGVKTVICTDISRDGAMRGTNRALYQALNETFHMEFIASGGVSSMDDVRALKALNVYGSI
jgi:phosphoribosylformimino-5-aminoimidazole carboxamide ribotide isomerase